MSKASFEDQLLFNIVSEKMKVWANKHEFTCDRMDSSCHVFNRQYKNGCITMAIFISESGVSLNLYASGLVMEVHYISKFRLKDFDEWVSKLLTGIRRKMNAEIL